MFTDGQLLFAKIFIVSFVAFMIYLYRKDVKMHKRYYPNVWHVGLAVFLIIVLFAIITFSLHK